MKNLYSCEKCNKLFEDWDACSKHENEHRTLQISPSDYLVESMSTYNETDLVPAVIYAGYYVDGDVPVLYKYKLAGSDPAASTKLAKLVQDRADQNAKDAAERQVILTAMLVELDEANVDIFADDRTSYWTINKLYKEQFGKYYEKN